ncbi:hypothetical protein CCH79_00000569 [Gambusia affinis]|uniref:Uncharacterized protein n=1 Tax=Gambusia affinis TaxID=33528 RepID=A0A315VWK5_GAMAF|nr:hypothetical protein CCH79_00000569 [Gambusia affinis]
MTTEIREQRDMPTPASSSPPAERCSEADLQLSVCAETELHETEKKIIKDHSHTRIHTHPFNHHTLHHCRFASSLYLGFFPVELSVGLWNDGVCGEFELARS